MRLRLVLIAILALAPVHPGLAQAQIGAEITITIGPPAPKVEVIPVSPGGAEYVWLRGEWVWSPERTGYVWHPGHWAMHPMGFDVWTPGQWVLFNGAWRNLPGHWRSEREPAPPRPDQDGAGHRSAAGAQGGGDTGPGFSRLRVVPRALGVDGARVPVGARSLGAGALRIPRVGPRPLVPQRSLLVLHQRLLALTLAVRAVVGSTKDQTGPRSRERDPVAGPSPTSRRPTCSSMTETRRAQPCKHPPARPSDSDPSPCPTRSASSGRGPAASQPSSPGPCSSR